MVSAGGFRGGVRAGLRRCRRRRLRAGDAAREPRSRPGVCRARAVRPRLAPDGGRRHRDRYCRRCVLRPRRRPRLQCSGGKRCAASESSCFCTDVCGSDDDCAAHEACVGGAIAADREVLSFNARCVPATCRGPDDCGGSDCGVQQGFCGNVMGLSCRSAFDCVDNDDCAFGGFCVGNEGRSGWSCSYDRSWSCE